jgi:phosphohistidine phosphatase
MKILFIVRHGKSSWEDPRLPDHDRPLLPIGIKKTKRIAKYLNNKKIHPDLLYSSSAQRAYETANIIAEVIGYPKEKIKKERNLYHASPDEIYAELFALPDHLNSVMIFGHNPTLTYFVNDFLSPTIENLPTTGTVSINFDCDTWEQLSDSAFHVNFVIFPKMLKKTE